MFFNVAILSKRGPLAKVWLAAHLERKLTKAALLQASIPKSVEAIVGEQMIPMALRLSGQLLLGVARIYSRKARYLMEDCTDTLSKVKMAFRPGAVDMTEEQAHVAKGAITRTDQTNEYDMMFNDQNYDWSVYLVLCSFVVADCSCREEELAQVLAQPTRTGPKKSITAADADITLPETEFDLDDGGIRYGMDLDFGVEGIESQQYGGESFHLDLDIGSGLDGPSASGSGKRKRVDGDDADEDQSVELGRDAANSSARKSARMSSPNGDLLPLDGEGDVTADLNRSALDDQFEPEIGQDAVNPDLSLDFGGGGFDLGLDFDQPLAGISSMQTVSK